MAKSLTFARGGKPVKKTVDIAELITESATFALRGSAAKLELSLPDDLLAVDIDEGQINQVIYNLVINADEAMPSGGVLGIRAKNTIIGTRSALPLDKGKYVEIIVEDQGTGIPKEHLDRIFDPYFTIKQKGSGLGLATAYSIINNHRGYITVKSKLSVGTSFHIYLPASEKPLLAEKETEPAVQLVGEGRILVMDDEDSIRELLNSELSDDGYEVELARDGAEAIKLYKNSYQIINNILP